jgi:hypothetical protein
MVRRNAATGETGVQVRLHHFVCPAEPCETVGVFELLLRARNHVAGIEKHGVLFVVTAGHEVALHALCERSFLKGEDHPAGRVEDAEFGGQSRRACLVFDRGSTSKL